jgi:hypothetical protein
MADVRTQPVVEDTGSEELRQLRKSYNGLLDVVGTLLDALETAADVGAVNAAAVAALASIESDTATVKKIGGEPGVPSRHQFPVTTV